ncbi:MAG: Uma2 family endonuclease [Candidatus Contendobacter sp.]
MIRWLAKLLNGGEPLVECGIQTAEGVKVADVAWGSTAFFKRNQPANPYLEAPEIVVEILSPSNTAEEMREKQALYFERGAWEFWLCDQTGGTVFF